MAASIGRLAVSGRSGPIRLGFITDMTGPYAGLDGPAGAEAIRMAVADMGGAVAGRPIEVLAGDHLNNRDTAARIAQQWFEEKTVDALVGGVNSTASLAMAEVARERRRPYLAVGSGNTAHTVEQQSPYTIHYAYDTAAQGRVTGSAFADQKPRSWFFVTADYGFGSQLQDHAAAALTAAGGAVIGSARHPYGASDVSSAVRRAGDSRAEVLGLASGHGDAINAVREAGRLGLTRTMEIAGLFMFIDEVHALGLEAAQGIYIADSWFWTRDARTRAWGRRFFGKFGRMPSSLHAADYSAALQYLAAVKAVGSTKAEAVLTQLKRTAFNDVFLENGFIRPDGRMSHDFYLLRVKPPSQSSEPWDYYDLLRVFREDRPRDAQ